MMHSKRFMPVLWVSLFLFVFCGSAFAQGKSGVAKARHFGIGQPKYVQELPYGQLRKDMEKLPPKAKGKALGWLQGFSFPAEDAKFLRVSINGDVHYADSFESGASGGTESAAMEASPAVDISQVFKLHSRPGASNVLFLDFDGHVVSGTAWRSHDLIALPYDPSGNDSPPTVANFTTDELHRIAEIWHRVSEDYAAFDIDVTTEEPAVFTPTTGRVLFTHDTDANGLGMPSQGVGGVGFVNVFGKVDYATKWSPVFVYYTNLLSNDQGEPGYNAEVASHEFGHNIGLSHDGATDGTTYYAGHGSGLVSWAPIMGYMLYKNVTQWSKGEYPGANNSQDDLAILRGDLGFVGDDHGDSASQATALVVETNGDILVSSPELDPDNVLSENKGIIDQRDDVDWFYVDLATDGSLNITATPAWHSFTRNEKRGSNLDIELTLMDTDLNVVDFDDPEDDTGARLQVSLPAGRYYIQVDGVGNNTFSDYSDYASVGMYFLEGRVEGGTVVENDPDTTPPAPGDMDWQDNPHATGTTSMSMTAVEATDESGGVQYLFTCVAGGNGCSNSGWQTGRTYSLSGLDPDTYYAFKVRARDIHGNQNTDSATMGDTTNAPEPPPPPPPVIENKAPVAVASYSPDPAVITKGKSLDITLDGSGSSDPDGTVSSWLWKDSSGNTIGEGISISLRLKEGTHTYSLTVADNEGATATTSLSVSVTKDAGGGGGGGKGKPPKG